MKQSEAIRKIAFKQPAPGDHLHAEDERKLMAIFGLAKPDEKKKKLIGKTVANTVEHHFAMRNIPEKEIARIIDEALQQYWDTH